VRDPHPRAIDRLAAELGGDPRYLAALLGGSIARGTELADSDVDLVLIASPGESARREAEGDFGYVNGAPTPRPSSGR
jgi:predicted nucleotidyltransferase